MNGSPIWTEGRFSSDPSRSWLASTLAPPIPSRPVAAPKSTIGFPTPVALARSTRSVGSSPTHIAFTRQLSAYASSKTTSPPAFAIPIALP